jgi:hypothetical protein
MGNKKTGQSYHDVTVFVDGEAHRIAGNYAYQLTCTKMGGWQLWHKWGRQEARLIGGEYDDGTFRIEIAGVVVCGKKLRGAHEEPEARVGGWTGEVRAGG